MASPEAFSPTSSAGASHPPPSLPESERSAKRRRRNENGKFACSFSGCCKEYGDSTNVIRHEHTHTGKRPCVCDFEGCGAKFTEPTSLKNHMRIHTGERPYKCEVPGCEAAFAKLISLKVHAMIHTGERPHVCEAEGCDARFITKSALKQHFARHHTERGIQRQKKREEQVAKFLTGAKVPFDRETTVHFCGEADKKYARVDFTIYFKDRVVALEIDEEAHKHYPTGCDVARMMNIATQHTMRNTLPLHFIRYNPDAFTADGVKQKPTMAQRHAWLLNEIATPVKEFTITYVCYDSAHCTALVLQDPEFPAELRASCRTAF